VCYINIDVFLTAISICIGLLSISHKVTSCLLVRGFLILGSTATGILVLPTLQKNSGGGP
jgi:hypothetical protein